MSGRTHARKETIEERDSRIEGAYAARMPAKPFKVVGPAAPTQIARLPDGKFTRGEILPAPQMVRRSSDQGVEVSKLIDENPAVEHPRPKGTPATTPSEIPWPELGATFNEARRPPFHLKGR